MCKPNLGEAVRSAASPKKMFSSKRARISVGDPFDLTGETTKMDAEAAVKQAKKDEKMAREDAARRVAGLAKQRRRQGRAATLLAGGFDTSTGSASGYNQTTLLGG